MTHLYLIRHCEAESNLYRRCCGQYDCQVTENGLRQISALTDRFASIHLDAVYSSDIYRAMRTVSPLAERQGLTVTPVSGVREMHMGNWENQAWGNISMFDPVGHDQFIKAAHQLDLRPSGGESIWGVSRRVRDTLAMLAEAHPGQTIAVATHGTALRSFLSEAMKKPREFLSYLPLSPNTGISSVFYDGGRFEVEYYNDGVHIHDRFQPVRPDETRHSLVMGEDKLFWFRPATEEDLLFLRSVLKQEEVQLTPSSCLYVGVMNGQPGGFYALDDTFSNAAEMCYFWVTPELRGKRLALQLLGDACSRTGLMGKTALIVRPDRCSQHFIDFLKRNMFIFIGEHWEKPIFAPSII